MELVRFLQELARGRGSVDWTGWLPVALEATGDEAWTDAWRMLSAADQMAVLSRLQADRGVFADTLVMLAAREVSTNPDPQVREMILWDAADADTRLADALEAWRARVREQLSAAQRAEAEAAEEVIRLEAELATLRSNNVGGDVERMIQLQGEVASLRAVAERFASFDRQAAERERNQLSAQVDELQREVDEHGQAVSRLRDELCALDVEARRLQPEVSSLTEAQTDETARVEQLRRDAASREAEVQQLRADSERLQAAQRQHEERISALRRDRELLSELESSPVAACAREISQAVDQLLSSLPSDEADRQVASRAPRTTD